MALDGLKSLSKDDFLLALADVSPGVREHALRLAEPHLADSPALLDTVLSMSADPQPRVRFQLAFTLGETNDARAIAALAQIGREMLMIHGCKRPFSRPAPIVATN